MNVLVPQYFNPNFNVPSKFGFNSEIYKVLVSFQHYLGEMKENKGLV
jgi:hypothetical protein